MSREMRMTVGCGQGLGEIQLCGDWQWHQRRVVKGDLARPLALKEGMCELRSEGHRLFGFPGCMFFVHMELLSSCGGHLGWPLSWLCVQLSWEWKPQR